MLGFDLHWWETAMLVSLGVAAIAAALVGVATYAVVHLQRQEAKTTAAEFAQYKVDAGVKIAEASEGAAKADERAAQANERAANAEHKAAEANLALEIFKAPRSLTRSQQDRLRDKLELFRGVSIDIFRFGETPEIVRFSTLLVVPLKEAGWSPRDWNSIGGGAATGVLVMTRQGTDNNVLMAASALVTALRDVGIESGPWQAPENWSAAPGGMLNGPPWEPDKSAPIRMIIGTKP